MTFISIGKVCELLGISLSTAYRWLKSGKITEDFRTLGQHRRFNEQDLVQAPLKVC
jgi:excisionase family DNA binding protein